MSKKMKNIVLIAIAFFVCGISEVGAKEVAKECKYKTPSSVASEQQTSILCNIYDDESHVCLIEIDGTEVTTTWKRLTILNWKKKLTDGVPAYNPNGATCVEYLVATIDKSVGGYNLWGFTDSSVAEQWKENREKYYTTIVLSPIKDDMNEIEQQLWDIKSSIEDVKKGYDFEKCIYVTANPKSNLQNGCIPEANSRLEKIKKYEDELQKLIDSGTTTDNNALVIEIKELLLDAEKFFTNELQNLQRMLEALENGRNFSEALIIYNGNYVKPGENPTPTDKESCAILGNTLTPIVKWTIDLVYIAIPIIIIILTIVDFVGIVLSGEDKNFKAAGSKLVKRLLIGVIIIFLPMLLAFLIDLSGALVPYGIGRNQLFCSLF